jgi:hypothetical protein
MKKTVVPADLVDARAADMLARISSWRGMRQRIVSRHG